MSDPRIVQLAKNLIHYSCKLEKGERVLIQCSGNSPYELTKECIRQAYLVGAEPHLNLLDADLLQTILKNCTVSQLQFMAHYNLECMKGMNAYIGIRGWDNAHAMAEVSSENNTLYMQHFVHPVHFERRVNHTKWVVLHYPNNSMAQTAQMTLDSFTDFYFKVCNLDYSTMSKAMDGLVALMERTDRVKIRGEGTDLSFSIKDIPVVKCDGLRNIPDGEVYTAPVRNSVNGVLTYNCPAHNDGDSFTYDAISFHFKEGKIVKASANDSKRLNRFLDTDEGARYIGEFALGCNPFITKAMKNALFDEKIRGSFHFTPGNCYKHASNGNSSSIHWDLVAIQTPDYGGGEIYFDDVLIRKDGLFVLPELIPLNPEPLKKAMGIES